MTVITLPESNIWPTLRAALPVLADHRASARWGHPADATGSPETIASHIDDLLTVDDPPPSPSGSTLHGAHGDARGSMSDDAWRAFDTAGMQAIKLLSTADDATLQQASRRGVFVMTRLFDTFVEGDGTPRMITPSAFVHHTFDDASRHYDAGVRHFEVHNEPNLWVEAGRSWHNGAQFGQWLLEVVAQYRALLPDARFGWPGLSPGWSVPGVRMNSREFLAAAKPAAAAMDFVCLHSYWLDRAMMEGDPFGGQNHVHYAREFPDRDLYVTEFANVQELHLQPPEAKAAQYADYYRALPSQVRAAFAFVLDAAPGDWPEQVWARSGIAAAIARVM